MTNETVITVVGNLTDDPELRYTQGGLAVAKLTIASTPQTTDRQTGERKDGEPLFLDAEVWREFAENVSATLRKGIRVIARGTLRQRRWQTEAGEKRSRMVLELDSIGPDLRWARANVERVTKTSPGGYGFAQPSQPQPAEPWADVPPYDETPF